VLTDPSLRVAMGAESLRRAEDLSIDLMAERLAGLYAMVVEAKPPARRRRAVPGVDRVSRQLQRLRRRGRVLVRRYL
jgi:hypothetical protein